jgi:hypothetical protein
MRRIPLIVGAVMLSFVATAGVIAVSSGVSAAASSAQSTYKAAIAFAGTEDVHYASYAKQQGAVLRAAGDTSPTAGSVSLTVKNGTVLEALTVTLVGSTGYLRGNAAALTKILGLSASQSTTYADKWLSFPTSNSSLDQLASGLRNKDVSAELKLSGPFSTVAGKTIDGHATQGVRGYTTGSSNTKVATTLYVETGGTPRPLEEVSNSGTGSKAVDGSVTFSNWGQKTHVTKPSHAVSILSLASGS